MKKIYDSNEPQYRWCFISLKSHDDENGHTSGNILSIGWMNRYKSWLLDRQYIKPIFDYYSYNYEAEGMSSTEYYSGGGEQKLIDKGVKPQFSHYVENRWGIGLISINEDSFGAFEMYAAKPEQLTGRSNYKPLLDIYWFLPWSNRELSLSQLLDIDGNVWYTKDRDAYKKDALEAMKLDEQYEESQPKIKVLFKDYDGKEITATLSKSYSEYRLGTSKNWRRFFKLFGVKPTTYVSMSIEYSSEVGPEKESWKGGVTGMAISLDNKEDDMVEAFKKFCKESEGVTKRRELRDLEFVKVITRSQMSW